ncbi:MAG TPA: sensor histidine kinase [Bryobacteraceae bacterium]|nr:sensor histidine kinase [Bryobacteraceae bacterium]
MGPAEPEAQTRTRLILLAGFGGLLGLMAVGGFDAIQVLQLIQSRSVQIRQVFLIRNRALDHIRSSLYLSGTVVRDYLLDPEPAGAADELQRLRALRGEMASAMDAYGKSLSASEAEPVRALETGLDAYWDVLEPALRWSPQQRHERGYAFVRQALLPRRAAVLDLADKIAALNEQELNGGDERLEETFGRFRRRLLVMLAATLSIGLLLAAVAAWHILRLERQSAARYLQVMRAQNELKELSARLVKAQEEERRAISRELHDEVGQSLSALLMELGNLAAVAPRNLEPLQRHLESIRKLAESSVQVARNMALLLRPSMLDDFGLVPALEFQAREISKLSGMAVSVEAGEIFDPLPDDHNTCVYRVVQEALHNCARHAHARSVRIRVCQAADRILLSIQDDGRGFDAQRVRGLGLVGMEERVEHLGGTFQVRSEPGHGTVLDVELPLPTGQVEQTAVPGA